MQRSLSKPASARELQYRPDIDGLRAVAVLAVVFFHLAQSIVPGGFIGVDIFFVISGYLIGSRVLSEVDARSFSFARFYSRRIRRIAPAYCVMIVIVSIAMRYTKYPSELVDYAWTLGATLLSISNLAFFTSSGYFTTAAERVPRLHTWSLSVEEQFYALFPLLVVLAHRFRPSTVRPAIWCVFLVSLVASVLMTPVAPIASFYLIFTRAWELLLGTLLAMGLLRSVTPRYAKLMPFAGAALIAVPLWTYSPGLAFPGLAAVPPCLGTALIIASGGGRATIVTRCLSWRPVVFIGLISYSLYLWHWPLYVLQNSESLFVATDSKLVARGVVLILSLVAATATWAWVEVPTRSLAAFSTKAINQSVGVTMLALGFFAVVLIATGGLPDRFSPQAVAAAKFLSYDERQQFRTSTCFLMEHDTFARFDRTACLPSRPGHERIYVYGDSHAASLYAGLSEVFPEADIQQVTGVKCVPTLRPQPSEGAACDGLRKTVLAAATNDAKGAPKLLLSARWNAGSVAPNKSFTTEWLDDLAQTAKTLQLKGFNVFVVGPVPEYDMPLPRVLADSIVRTDDGLVTRHLLPGPKALDAVMERKLSQAGVKYISLFRLLCDRGCRTSDDQGSPLMFDRSHFTRGGSISVARLLAKAF